MAQLTFWGDFKANNTEHLNISGELELLLNNSDVNVVNFEAPVKTKAKPIKKSGPNHSQSIDSPEWLESHGFNLISLANNHTFDYGEEGLVKTINSFNKAKVIGAGTYNDAYQRYITTTEDGLKICFIAGTHAEFGTLTDTQNSYGTAWCFSPEFERNIREKENIDFLIIINHAGIEYMKHPLPEWRETYKKWIDMGADAVIASHPHIPQGWENYKGKPIFYSLGNFCFQKDKANKEHWYESLCVSLTIEKGKEMQCEVKPVIYDQDTGYISENNAPDFASYIQTLNNELKNDDTYYEYVNHYVKKIYKNYINNFTRSGIIANFSAKNIAKGIVEKFKKEHIYNCFNCESHRWAILRAMKGIYSIDGH